MKIVILDGYCLNPGDLSWSGLEALGEVEVFDRTAPGEVEARARGAGILLTNKTPIPGEVIGRLESLRYIGLLATGFNVVDIEAAKARDIPVTNVPTYGTRSVAQMVFAHVLNFTQHAAHHGDTVREGRWSACPDFCYWDRPLIELDGLTLGLVGFGRIGRATAEAGLAFGMKVRFFDPTPGKPLTGAEPCDLDALLAASDVVSLHCPLTPDTEWLMNADRLARMRPTAFLVNTSRGPLVDEAALAEALAAGRIAGAGLDVLCVEPPEPDNPLLTAPNCVITPHIAWATEGARSRLMDQVVENVRAFLEGRLVNVVNGVGPAR